MKLTRLLLIVPLVIVLGAPASSLAVKPEGKVKLRKLPASKLNARVGYGRTLDKPQQWTDQEYKDLQAKFVTVNPPQPSQDSKAPEGPFTKPALNSEGYPQLNSQGATRPLWGSSPPPLITSPVVTTATNTILATMPVAQGSDGAGHAQTSTVAEPSVAGVPGALIYTGNWHAAVSDTDGLSWQYLDPYNMFPASDGTAKSDNGFCCDQVALSERSTSSSALTAWLGQSNNVSATDGNRLRLLTYRGSDQLIDQDGYCSIDLTPQAAGYDNSTMYDFNQMARTKKWLYITTNVYDLSPDDESDDDSDPQKTAREARMYRVSIADLKRGDCTPDIGTGVPTSGFTVSPAQNSDDRTSMFMAAHTQITYRGEDRGDGLIVYRVKDSGSTIDYFLTDIKDYPKSSREDISCPLPDGTDACLRSDDRITTGFRLDNRAGWFWNVKQGAGYDHPHIQGAVVNLDDLNTAFEPVIWSPDNAWIYPTVQVNSSGEVGMTAYKAGGGDYTRARSFLVKSPKSSSSWSGMQSQGIINSSHGVSRNVWGDYSTISPYPGCSKTFAAAVWSMQGGSSNADSQHRFAWFGENGCANLKVEQVLYLPYTAKPGDLLAVGVTARNTGSASAGSSKSYLYLSSNSEKDSTDTYIGKISHVSIASGASAADGETPTIPRSTRTGSYYIIACADGEGSVTETSENDNCSASEHLVTIARDPIKLASGLYGVNISQLAEARGRNHPLIEQSIISRDIPSLIKLQPVIETYVSVKPVFSNKAILLVKQIPRPPRPVRPQTVRPQADQDAEPKFRVLEDGTYELPLDKAELNLEKLKPGRYFAFTCLRGAQNKVKAADCVGVGQLNRMGFRKASKGKGQ